MAKDAWDAVQPTTIKHCWDHTGIQRDPIMLRIPVRNDSGHAISQVSSDAWNTLEDLATSRKTLPESEDSLKEIYGGTYEDSIWRPALAAITGSETTEAALDELAKFKAKFKENAARMVNKADGQADTVETDLMEAVTELKARRRIFGSLPSLDDLVNPPGELEIGEGLELFKSDADIVKAVQKKVSEEESTEDEIEECSPPRMS